MDMPITVHRCSLDDFLKEHEEHLERLSETGEPEILTVDGEPRLVVQDAAAYSCLRERLELLATAKLLEERAEASRSGDEITIEQMFKEMDEVIAKHAQ